MNRAGKILLSPLAALYGAGVAIRHALYEAGVFKRLTFDVPVVCVGNISTGGTGKSPFVIYLAEKLTDRHPAILSRGYGRKTKGFRWVQSNSKAAECGDEPLMIKRQYSDLPVAVAENRALAIPQILMGHPEVGVILMDDGMQHLAVKPDLLVVLTSWQEPFTRDHILPLGNLREKRQRASIADLIIVTKTPDDCDEAAKAKLVAEIRAYSRAPVFFAGLEYPELFKWPERHQANISIYDKVLGISALANHSLFEEKIKLLFNSIEFRSYPDHYPFKREDVEQWIRMLEGGKARKAIVSTEKDLVRIEPHKAILQKAGIDLLIQTIRVKIIGDEKNLLRLLRQKIEKEV